MTKDRALLVLEILHRHCGYEYDDGEKDIFIFWMEKDCPEYRFMGNLGFGGKIYNEHDRLRVGYYPEDKHHERELDVMLANEELKKI